MEKLNATIAGREVALSLTISTFDYKVAFSFSIGDRYKCLCFFVYIVCLFVIISFTVRIS